jgi:hypothetical protein
MRRSAVCGWRLDMTDIVEKLKLTYQTPSTDKTHTLTVHLNPDGEEAAKEIEDLRTRNSILRDVIEDMEHQITFLNVQLEKLDKPRQRTANAR